MKHLKTRMDSVQFSYCMKLLILLGIIQVTNKLKSNFAFSVFKWLIFTWLICHDLPDSMTIFHIVIHQKVLCFHFCVCLYFCETIWNCISKIQKEVVRRDTVSISCVYLYVSKHVSIFKINLEDYYILYLSVFLYLSVYLWDYKTAYTKSIRLYILSQI